MIAHPWLEWLAANPGWAGLAVFLISLAESLVIVGLFVPGVILLFVVGALVAAGGMDLLPTLAWAAAGGVAGDLTGYWLGRYLRERLVTVWPMVRYPDLMARGRAFFDRHGGKSVFVGRFVGPVRPVIPAIAGMMVMPASRFTLISITACLLWAPLYILPGVVFGASLRLAAEVATRLVLLLLLTAALIWITAWGVRAAARRLAPYTAALPDAWMEWSRRQGRLGTLPAALLDPYHPEARGLLVLALVLIAAAWAIMATGALIAGAGTGPSHLDVTAYYLLQGLHTPWGDHVMTVVGGLGDPQVYGTVTVAVSLWLAATGRRHALLYWAGAVAAGAALVFTTEWGGPLLRPFALPDQPATVAWINHPAMSLVVYGFLAVLIARELPDAVRAWPYGLAAAVTAMVGLAQLYLGERWLSPTIIGLALAIAWIALLGLAFRRHTPGPVNGPWLGTVALAAAVSAAAWHVPAGLTAEPPRPEVRRMAAADWWDSGWMTVAPHRIDLVGRRDAPFTLQWAGSLESLRTRLVEAGWREPIPVTGSSILRWLSGTAPIEELPVLPHIHDGQHEALRLTRPSDAADGQIVVRVWHAGIALTPGDQPLWLASLSYQHVSRPMALLAYPRTDTRRLPPVRTLAHDLEPAAVRRVQWPPLEPDTRRRAPLYLLLARPGDSGSGSDP